MKTITEIPVPTRPEHTPGPIPLDTHGEYATLQPCKHTNAKNADGPESLRADSAALPAIEKQSPDGEKKIQKRQNNKKQDGSLTAYAENPDTSRCGNESSGKTIQKKQNKTGKGGNNYSQKAQSQGTNSKESGSETTENADIAGKKSKPTDSTQKIRGDSIMFSRLQTAENTKPLILSLAVKSATQSKATPGPWDVEPKGSRHFVDGADGLTVAYLDRAGVRERSEIEANARLIASAPELLEALELALETIYGQAELLRACGAAYGIGATLKRATEAIAKAKGGAA